MKHMTLLAVAVAFGLVACQDQPELGPVIHRDGLISTVKTGITGYQYKDVILSGVAICDADESVEIAGTISQGTVVSSVEGGFVCIAGTTVKWVDNFGSNGSFPPDARLQPGPADVNLRFDADVVGDRVYIRRTVTLVGT